MTDIHELSISRLIDAPVDAVWRAWTEDTGAWFCHRPWTAQFVTQELVAGGRSEIVMRGLNGEENRLEGVYLEVVPRERIVSTDAFTAGWVPAGPFMVRIDTFADEGGQTRYTATARHWTAEAKQTTRRWGSKPAGTRRRISWRRSRWRWPDGSYCGWEGQDESDELRAR